MKKSIALVVAFIALLGIVLVASFGTNPQNIIVPVYIETITLLDMDGSPLPSNPQGDKYLTLNFEPTFVDEEGVEYMRYAFSLEFNAGGEPPSSEDVIFTLGQAAVDPSDGLPVFSFEEDENSPDYEEPEEETSEEEYKAFHHLLEQTSQYAAENSLILPICLSSCGDCFTQIFRSDVLFQTAPLTDLPDSPADDAFIVSLIESLWGDSSSN